MKNPYEPSAVTDAETADTDTQKEYIVYPKRHTIAGVFALAQVITSIIFPTVAPIQKHLQNAYEFSEPTSINMGPLLYMLTHPLFTICANGVIEKNGLAAGVRIGSLFLLLGVGLRVLVYYNWHFVTIGYIIAGIGRPFILNA